MKLALAVLPLVFLSGCLEMALNAADRQIHKKENEETTRRWIAEKQASDMRVAEEDAKRAEFTRLRDFEVLVASDPPGAMIEVNEDARGRAPLVIQVEGREDRTVGRMLTVRAIPSEPGDAVQTKFVMTGDRIPQRMFFDMHLVRQPRQINVHVDSNP